MRVIAGQLGGRKIQQPHGHRTHPMSEKVRGAIFNTLGDIEGLTILDAFAGTGALSLEAISRGAKHATAIDLDKKAIEAMRLSAKDLGVESKMRIARINAKSWSDKNRLVQVDILLLDPPYEDLQITLLFEKLINRHLKPSGLTVLSYPGHDQAPKFENTKILLNKKYGDAQLVFYRKIS